MVTLDNHLMDLKAHKKRRGHFHGEEGWNSHQDALRLNAASKAALEHLSFTSSLPGTWPLLSWRLLLELPGQAAANPAPTSLLPHP